MCELRTCTCAGRVGLPQNQIKLDEAANAGTLPSLDAVRFELKKVMDSKYPKISIVGSTMGCHNQPVVSNCYHMRKVILTHGLKVHSHTTHLCTLRQVLPVCTHLIFSASALLLVALGNCTESCTCQASECY